jgi:putative copper export protein
VISPTWDTLRLFLHVLAATVWVGGQLTLVALLPLLRRQGDDLPRQAARVYNRVAWPAFGLLVVTGAWTVAVEPGDAEGYDATLVVKLALVALAGLAAYAHIVLPSRTAKGVLGATAALCSLGALLLGILLAG